MTAPQNIWLHRFALLVAGATLVLLAAGASVTSTGSGLAVPDWPLSYGTLFPRMEGGVLYEHGHRLIAGVVLILTTVLTFWLFRSEERAWIRRLALAALAALLAQALLGGLTVLFGLPTAISVSHAGLAAAFFCATVSLALFTSPGWREAPRTTGIAAAAAFRGLTLVTTAVIYLQILLGAVMRHTGAGLAIPDFPLSYGRLVPPVFSPPIAVHYAHRVGALVVCVCVFVLIARIVRHRRRAETPLRPAMLLGALLTLQILLGALTIWTRRAVVPTTAHVAMGAGILAVSLVLTLRSWRPLSVAAEKGNDGDIRRGVSRGRAAETPGESIASALLDALSETRGNKGPA